MAFPISPVDGQLYTTAFGSTYKYYAIDDKWVKDGKVPIGNPGVTGLQGVTGLAGATGTIGITGLGEQGVTGLVGLTGLPGSTGIQGVTGLIGLTGAIGNTGSQGHTGLANFLDRADWPAVGSPPILLWNEVDEALYVGLTAVGKWVQVSSGSLQGTTGIRGLPGMAVTGMFNMVLKADTLVTGIQGDFRLPFNIMLDGWMEPHDPKYR